MARKIIVYGTPASYTVKPFCKILDKSEISYKYVDIQQNDKAKERVKAINDGNASVPTIVFRDGTTLTKPSKKQFTAKLKDSGYTVQKQTVSDRIISFFANPFLAILGVVDIILGSLMSINNLVILGFVLVGLYVVFGRILPYFKKAQR